MKKGDLALYISLAVIIFIFFGIFFLPMFIVYGGFGLLDPFAVKEKYTSGLLHIPPKAKNRSKT